jgi:hypothetical protein
MFKMARFSHVNTSRMVEAGKEDGSLLDFHRSVDVDCFRCATQCMDTFARHPWRDCCCVDAAAVPSLVYAQRRCSWFKSITKELTRRSTRTPHQTADSKRRKLFSLSSFMTAVSLHDAQVQAPPCARRICSASVEIARRALFDKQCSTRDPGIRCAHGLGTHAASPPILLLPALDPTCNRTAHRTRTRTGPWLCTGCTCA